MTSQEAVEAEVEIRAVRNVLIPLSDGVTLVADLHLPADGSPVPVLVSFNPYRKDDICGAFSEHWRRYFVSRGYAHLLVDVRGTGGSRGVIADSFDAQEGLDGAEVVEWAAAQPWCDGSVAVWGMSYAGAMVLAVASQRPPHLRAAACVYGYSDIYSDSAFPGGCPAALGRFIRETWMLALALAPPTYRDNQGRWLEVWRERLANIDRTGPYTLGWPGHPDRDDFWQERATAVERIEVPTFIIGGWRDIFPEAMVRVYERLLCPKKLIVGPWLHGSPDASPVGTIDWLRLIGDFWDRSLGAREVTIAESPVTLFVQGSDTWRNERNWPIARTSTETLRLAPGSRLVAVDGDEGVDRFVADACVGTTAGLWSPLGEGTGTPIDQGPDNLLSQVYTGDPLPEPVEITGSPEAVISATLVRGSDLNLVVKLQDVAPDGRASLITTGWLRGTHVAGHHRGTPIGEGETRQFHVQLWATSYCVASGHRLRVAVSCGDFPRIWPVATSPVIDIHLGPERSFVRLPVIPAQIMDDTPPVEMPRPPAGVNLDPWSRGGSAEWLLTRDPVRNAISVQQGAWQELELPDGTIFRVRHEATASVRSQCPDEASIKASAGIEIETPGGERVEVTTKAMVSHGRQLFEGAVELDHISYYSGVWRNY